MGNFIPYRCFPYRFITAFITALSTALITALITAFITTLVGHVRNGVLSTSVEWGFVVPPDGANLSRQPVLKRLSVMEVRTTGIT